MENLPIKSEQEIIATKKAAWAGYALESHNKLIELTNRSNASVEIAKKLPTTIEEIIASEATLKTLKAEANSIKSDRLATTGKLDTFFNKFMQPEKDLIAVIPAYENAIIGLKNKKATADQLQSNITNELKNCKESFLIYVNNRKAEIDNIIIDVIAKSYEWALKNAKSADIITMNEVDLPLKDYISKAKFSKNASCFLISRPDYNAKNITIEQVNQIWNEVESTINVHADGKVNAGRFSSEMEDKFKYFAIAFKDIERAIAHSEKVANELKSEVNITNDQQNIGAKLSVNATVLSNEPTTKALKEKFELDMPNTQESALLVIAAFVANIGKTASEIRADWMKVTVTQMANALVSLKNKDNSFAVSGINFKVVQKL
jgi:hypothetical protein